jgi:hypothetical protein
LVLLVGMFLFPVCGLLSWQLSIGSSLTLTSTEVIVRNPFGVSRTLLREIADVNAGYGGVAIWRVDRTGVSAWAVQKTVIATWFRWHTRADDIVEAIRAAARASGAPPPPQQLVRPVPARSPWAKSFTATGAASIHVTEITSQPGDAITSLSPALAGRA